MIRFATLAAAAVMALAAPAAASTAPAPVHQHFHVGIRRQPDGIVAAPGSLWRINT